MGKFSKKPVIVEAVQFTNDADYDELFSFTGGLFDLVDIEDREDDPDITAQVFNGLHNTWVGVKYGQWIIKDSKGCFYPCDEDIFKETYEAL